jgi:hypothetical protein
MSKGGKGGSTGSTKIQVPSGIGQNANSLSQLGAYGAGYLPSLTSMANWASYIATGGNTTQANPFNAIGAGSAPLANQTLGYTTNLGSALGQESPTFANTGGYNPPSVTGITNVGSNAFGGSGGTGVVGTGGSTTSTGGTTATGGGSPAKAQQFPTIMGAGLSPGGYTGTPVNGDTPFYDQNTQKFIGQIHDGKFVPSASPPAGVPAMYQGFNTGGGVSTPQQAPASTGGSSGSILGPFLQNAWDAIQAEGVGANQLAGEGTQLFNEGQSLIPGANQLVAQGVGQMAEGEGIIGQGQGTFGQAQGTFGQGESILGQGESMLNQATSGTGLFPSQQALIDQTVKSQQAQIQQQMASEGLTSSTQNIQLQGQAAQQGDATAGTMIQGNIAAAQAQMGLGQSQESIGIQQMGVGLSQMGLGIQQEGVGQGTIGLGNQQLSLAENWSQLGVATQQAAIGAISAMASQSAGLQSQMWNQAMQGYGMIGQFLQTSMAGFGESSQSLAAELSASTAQAQLNAGIAQQQAQASSSGMSSLLGSLGSLLGGSGGGGSGGLIGSLGGLIGGAGAGAGIAAGGAAAAAGAGGVAAGAAGIGGGAALTAIGAALSCIVAREVYGTFNGTWKRFREWMMFEAPSPLLKLYVRHASGVAQWLKANPDWKPFFQHYMDMVLE